MIKAPVNRSIYTQIWDLNYISESNPKAGDF